MNNDQNHIDKDLLIRYLAGEAVPEEQHKVLRWVGENEDHKKQLEEYKKLLHLSDEHYASSVRLPVDIEQEWKAFLKNTGQSGTGRVVSMQPNPWRTWYRLAAVFIGVLIVGYCAMLIVNRNDALEFSTTENKLALTLPDGSRVTLNRHSSISYNDDFGDERRAMELKGEAFFEVTPDKQKPFVISVKDGRIEVVGTSFNVRAYDSLELTEVTVQSGVVKFAASTASKELTLAAGQRGIFTREQNTLVATDTKDENFLAWQTGKLTFRDTSLQEIAESLGKAYGVEVILPHDIQATCSFTGSFSGDSLDTILKVLASTLNLTYKVDGNRIEIISVGC